MHCFIIYLNSGRSANASTNSQNSEISEQDVTLPALNITKNNPEDINQTLEMVKLKSRSVLKNINRRITLKPIKVKSHNEDSIRK